MRGSTVGGRRSCGAEFGTASVRQSGSAGASPLGLASFFTFVVVSIELDVGFTLVKLVRDFRWMAVSLP